MKGQFRIAAVAGLVFGLFTVGIVSAQPSAPQTYKLKAMPEDAARHIQAALELEKQGTPRGAVGTLFNNTRRTDMIEPSLLPKTDYVGSARYPVPPTKAFDQLYYIGTNFIGCWVLNTREGLILWDTMDNVEEAQNIIEPGLRKLGLDPAEIRYIVLTHGHGDHFGGAPYFTAKYPDIHVLSADWKLMALTKLQPGSNFGAAPKRDRDITDGEKLTLGGTTVTFYVTPGHTPGAVSTLVPVTDHGVPHTVAIFGGVGIPQQVTPSEQTAGIDVYDRQVKRFQTIAAAAGVDTVISTHPGFDATADHIASMSKGYAGPSLWIMGKDGVARYWKMLGEVSAATRSIIVASGEQRGPSTH